MWTLPKDAARSCLAEVHIDTCAQAPYGNLVKVTSVSGNTVYTTPAAINEAVKNVDYETDFSIGTNTSNSSRNLSRDLSATINVPFNNVVVYDVDGKSSTTYDEVIANGGFFLDLDGYFKINLKNFRLNDFVLRGSGHDRLELKLNSRVSDPNFSVKDVIATYNKLPAVRILLPTVPPFPVIIKTDLDAFAGAKGSMNVENGAQIDKESYFDLGVSYDGTKWTPIKSFTKAFDFYPPNVSSLNLKIYAGADANFLLYGSAGVYLGPDAYLRFIAESNSLNVYKGLEAMLGVDVKFLGKTLADYNTQIPIYEDLVSSTPINNGGGNSGGGSNVRTKTVDIQPGPEGKDTYFKRGHYIPNNSSFYENGGNSQVLEVDNYNKSDGYVDAKSFIEFPLSSIPANSIIDSAKLKIFGAQNSYFSGNLVEISKVTSSWDEYFPDEGPSWNSAAAASFYLTGNAQWYEPNITSLVQGWVDGDPNYGIALHDLSRTNGDFFTPTYSFFSSDYQADTSERPILEVTYETQN